MKNNNSGMTLVELVLGILILGISTSFLVSSFTTIANVTNKATRYKNAAATAQIMVELQDETYAKSNHKDTNTELKLTRDSGKSITVKYTKTGDPTVKTFTMNGELLKASDVKGSSLSYKEYLPGNFYFE